MSTKPLNKVLANWLNNDFRGLLEKHNLTIENCGITADEFGFLVNLVRIEVLTRDELRDILQRRLTEVSHNVNH